MCQGYSHALLYSTKPAVFQGDVSLDKIKAGSLMIGLLGMFSTLYCIGNYDHVALLQNGAFLGLGLASMVISGKVYSTRQ